MIGDLAHALTTFCCPDKQAGSYAKRDGTSERSKILNTQLKQTFVAIHCFLGQLNSGISKLKTTCIVGMKIHFNRLYYACEQIFVIIVTPLQVLWGVKHTSKTTFFYPSYAQLTAQCDRTCAWAHNCLLWWLWQSCSSQCSNQPINMTLRTRQLLRYMASFVKRENDF